MSKCSATAGFARWVLMPVTVASLLSVVGGCSDRVSFQETEQEWGSQDNALKVGRRAPRPPEAEYYRFLPDEGSWCAEPICGRHYVQALNREETRCADGTLASTCYVAELHVDSLWPPGAERIVRGRIETKDFPDFEGLGVLVGDEVWGGSSSWAPPNALYFRVSKATAPCFRENCPTVRIERLNTRLWRPVLELDWDQAQATEEQLAVAEQSINDGELIVLGEVQGTERFVAERLVVAQVFLRSTAAECQYSADCPPVTWCRETQAGGHECVPYVPLGGTCNWSENPWEEKRCHTGIDVCDVPDREPDAPGVCRTFCKSSCDADSYCSPGGCRPHGSCEWATDCSRTNNIWERGDCPGFPTCENPGLNGQCAWQCGNPACMDLSNRDLGPCDDFVGYGVYGDACYPLTGCPGPTVYEVPTFTTLEECQTTCNLGNAP